MLTVEIRSVRPAEVSAVVLIANECGLSEWSPSDYERELERPDSIFLIAVNEIQNVVGFVLGRLVPGEAIDSKFAEIYNIGVFPGLRAMKVGSKLLHAFLDSCRHQLATEVFLEVRVSNVRAIKFYQKHGFTVQFRRPSFYSAPTEDATVMHAIV